MRLLRIDDSAGDHPTLSFEEFEYEQIPQYAILSHRWEEDEILFTHICNGTAVDRRGYSKIECAAKQARRDDLKYIWVDTCCIDKSSSAELSEAINSMFAWYELAEVCYAYLFDVVTINNVRDGHSEFACSEWWDRGWTLQELLAPKRLKFYSRNWMFIGEKHGLAQEIARKSGIETQVLTRERTLEEVSVAKRMSWAAFRKTTRIEDTAYCLMGMFQVNMPLLYGEGMKAFQRLQEEIMKYSDDHSLFAWRDENLPDDQIHGLLADSPSAFANSSKMMAYSDWESRTPFEMTNRGLRIDLYVTSLPDDIYLAALNCPEPSFDYRHFVAIYLMKLKTRNNQFVRFRCARLGAVSSRGTLETAFVRQRIPNIDELRIVPEQTMFLIFRHNSAALSTHRFIDMANTSVPQLLRQYLPFQKDSLIVREWLPRKFSSASQTLRGTRRLAVAIWLQRNTDDEGLVILFGTITSDQLGFDALEYRGDRPGSLQDLQARFDPQPTDATIKLQRHQVSISTTRHVSQDMISHVIDVDVRAAHLDVERPHRARAPSFTAAVGSVFRRSITPGRKSDASDTDSHREQSQEDLLSK